MRPNTPGATRFIAQLLDHADRNEGELPGKVTLTGYGLHEQQDVVAQIQRVHYERAGKTIRVNIDRWANDTHGGDKKALLEALYDAVGRKPDNSKAKQRRERQALAAAIMEMGGRSEPVLQLSNDALDGRGWIGASHRHAGFDVTRNRIRAYLRLVSALPSPEEIPLRSFCSRVLANSHALDDDSILRGALQRYVLSRWPNHEEEEGAWMEAGILIGTARGLVQAFGTLTLQKGNGRIDLGKLATAGIGVALERRCIEEADIIEKPAAATFVENPATYTELRSTVPMGHLLVLTDGFPSKATRALAQRLVQAGVPVRHWGDVDPEGFQILRQLGPDVKPWRMDQETVDGAASLTPLGSKEARFRRRLSQSIPPDEKAALEACIQRGGWLEQESMPAELPPDPKIRMTGPSP